MNDQARSELLRLRSLIDEIDLRLLSVLAERFSVTDQVGHLKADHDLPALDAEREATQLARLRSAAQERGLAPDVAEAVFRSVTAIVKQRHRAASAGNGS